MKDEYLVKINHKLHIMSLIPSEFYGKNYYRSACGTHIFYGGLKYAHILGKNDQVIEYAGSTCRGCFITRNHTIHVSAWKGII